MRARLLLLALAACHGAAHVAADAGTITPDAPAAPPIVITATVNSTRFVAREHMLAAAEMQISGEPLAEAMGRDLGSYSRIHIPPDLYFDASIYAAGPWIDLPGFSTGVESYEYSKQPMNNLAFEAGAGTSLGYAPLVNTDGAQRRRGGRARHRARAALRRRVERARPVRLPGRHVPEPPGERADNPLGWPGIWPTAHVFASFDPAITPTSTSARLLDQLGRQPGRERRRAVRRLRVRRGVAPPAATARRRSIRRSRPARTASRRGSTRCGSINYLQVMHDANESAVDGVDAGGSRERRRARQPGRRDGRRRRDRGRHVPRLERHRGLPGPAVLADDRQPRRRTGWRA